MTDGDDRYDLGVLFVHGIGQQGRGRTLTAWADPLIRWLEVWLRRESVEVGAAELGPLPEDPAAPAHVELRVVSCGRADDGPTTRRWLLTEAWWAEAFALPRFRELAFWGFAVLPWTVVAHFAARLQQAWHGPRTPRQAPGRGRLRALAGGPARIARVAWQSLGLFLAVALFPLLAVGVLAVVVLGAVPIPWVRHLAVALQRLLSTSVGDSFVLVSSPTRGQAIVTRVERDLRWLSDRCQRVAVVAHSQGAAIAHRAVRRVPPGERRLAKFVTVGSGQTKLVDLESLRDTDAAREVWLAPAGLLVLATSIWLAVDALRPGGREPADDGWWFGPLWVALMGLVFLLLGIGAAWPRRQPEADEVEVDAERGWLDLYASHDPVANRALSTCPPCPTARCRSARSPSTTSLRPCATTPAIGGTGTSSCRRSRPPWPTPPVSRSTTPGSGTPPPGGSRRRAGGGGSAGCRAAGPGRGDRGRAAGRAGQAGRRDRPLGRRPGHQQG